MGTVIVVTELVERSLIVIDTSEPDLTQPIVTLLNDREPLF